MVRSSPIHKERRRTREDVRSAAIERAGITRAEFDDFMSTDAAIRVVQDKVIWQLHRELGMRQREIDTWLECSPKRVATVLGEPEPPVLEPIKRTSVSTVNTAEREEKIDRAIAGAVKVLQVSKEELQQLRALRESTTATKGAILLVLEYWHVASFYALAKLGCTDSQAQQILAHAYHSLHDSTAPLYHATHELCKELGIRFEDLQNACT